MQHKRTLALILAVALLLGCIGYTPVQAVQPDKAAGAESAAGR